MDEYIQREIEDRMRVLSTNDGAAKQAIVMEKKLKMAEDRYEAMASLLKQKDEDLDKTVHHRNTLSSLFESDLTNMASRV